VLAAIQGVWFVEEMKLEVVDPLKEEDGVSTAEVDIEWTLSRRKTVCGGDEGWVGDCVEGALRARGDGKRQNIRRFVLPIFFVEFIIELENLADYQRV
jgi:hypothetical protein